MTRNDLVWTACLLVGCLLTGAAIYVMNRWGA